MQNDSDKNQKRKKYPCEQVCPEDFITNEDIERMIKHPENINFEPDDWKKLMNCVHCNECGTSHERAEILSKYIKSGNEYPQMEELRDNFQKYDTPYPTNTMRVKFPEGIPKDSDTLFFMGCLCTIRLPKYTEHALEYLLANEIDFTVVEKEICCGYPALAAGLTEEFKRIIDKNIRFWNQRGFKKIICLCPACYFIFNQDYPKEALKDIKIEYIADFLKPTENIKKGEVSIQHLCQLMNRGYTGYEDKIEEILLKSGYDVAKVPHYCCGGGIGYMGRTDVIDKIAQMRMKDFVGDFYTTYCPGCYWILKSYRKHLRDRKKTKLKDIFQLLM